jgi:hypothetical protein
MKQVLLFASFFAIAAITGCGTKPGEAQADGSAVTTPLNVSSLPQATTPTTTTGQPITAPTITTAPTTTAPVATTSTAGLNPAHGQPGHRCDLEVGAPLNSAPPTKTVTSDNKTTVAPQPVITTSTPTVVPSAVKTAPGMNPAHGQPGHRCDIAVGEPLNSKPAATTTTTTPTVTPTPVVNTPTIGNTTPVITSPATTTAAAAPGMNPAHGQPGHRCDIAVGAPLNSKADPLKVVPTETKTDTKKDN